MDADSAGIQLHRLPEASSDLQASAPQPCPPSTNSEGQPIPQPTHSDVLVPAQATGQPALELVNQQSLQEILKVANKLTKSSGVQSEIFQCMMEDEEVRELVHKQHRLITEYMRQHSISSPDIASSAPSHASSSEGLRHRQHTVNDNTREASAADTGAPAARIRNVWPGLDAAVVDDHHDSDRHSLQGAVGGLLAALGRAKCTLEVLGGHLMHHGGHLLQQGGRVANHLGRLIEQHTRQPGGGHEGESREEGQQRDQMALDAVMLVSVAMVCLSFVGRPLLLATAAAAASFLWQKQADQHNS